MRIENFPKLKRSDHSPKRDEFIDVSSDPPYFSLDSPFKDHSEISPRDLSQVGRWWPGKETGLRATLLGLE